MQETIHEESFINSRTNLEFYDSLKLINDLQHMQKDLVRQGSQIFIQNPELIWLESWHATVPPNESELETSIRLIKRVISSDQDLKSYLKGDNQDEESIKIFFISQATSWNRLKLSANMFSDLFRTYQLLPAFWDLISSFGYKNDDSDTYFDICYNLRYVRENGRGEGYPWVFRNFAVYQRLDTSEMITKKTTWIFIGLPSPLKKQLEQVLLGRPLARFGGLFWHLAFLGEASRGWRKYINYLEVKFQEIWEAVAYSDVEYTGESDYQFDFSKYQRLGALRNQLERSVKLLQSNSNVIGDIKTFAGELECCRYLGKPELRQIERNVLQELSKNRLHLRKIETLLNSYDFAAKLLFKLFDLRNNGLHFANGKALKELAFRSTIDSKSMISLSGDANQGTRFIKVSGLIALLYLPASLVATLFSTNLIVFGSQSQFQVRKEIWIFVVLTIILNVLTIALLKIVEKRRR